MAEATPSESAGDPAYSQPGARGSGRRRTASRVAAARSPNATPGSGGGQNCRFDSSLGLLTKKFVQLVEAAPDGVLDLNKAAENLSVQKRRIYDITNVLEGIGLIEKKSKNNIQWKGNGPAVADETQAEYAALKEEVAQMQADSRLLEDHIATMQSNVGLMTEHMANRVQQVSKIPFPPVRSRMYVTNEDVVKLRSFGEDTVFAVTAPYGTTLMVPDPDEGLEQGGERRYRAILTSKSDPIGVWLVSATHQAEDPSPLARTALGATPVQHTPHALKLEDQSFGQPGPSAPGLEGRGAMSPSLACASPSTFMKLQTPEMDPNCWYDHDVATPGLADIFGDHTSM